MKRVSWAIIVALVISIISFPVSAAETTTYYLDDVIVSIDMPNDWTVYTRSNLEEAAQKDKFGYGNNMRELFTNENWLLCSWDEDYSYELCITMITLEDGNSLNDFPVFSDDLLSDLAASKMNKEDDLQNGIVVTQSDVYQNQHVKYLRKFFSEPFDDTSSFTKYAIEYDTAFHGKYLDLRLTSYSGKIDAAHEKMIQTIVDSIEFEKPSNSSNDLESAPSFEYKDKVTGLSFTVPPGWVTADFNNSEFGFLSAKFASYWEPSRLISFKGYDLLDSLEDYEREVFEQKHISKNELDNSSLTSLWVADYYYEAQSAVSLTSYNGKEYFKIDTTDKRYVQQGSTTYIEPTGLPATYLFRVEQGLAYCFIFNGNDADPYYKDFEQLVSSANYPPIDLAAQQNTSQDDVSNNGQTLTDTQDGSQEITIGNQNKNKSIVLWIAIPSLIVMAAIIGVIVKKKGKSKKEQFNQDGIVSGEDEQPDNSDPLLSNTPVQASNDAEKSDTAERIPNTDSSTFEHVKEEDISIDGVTGSQSGNPCTSAEKSAQAFGEEPSESIEAVMHPPVGFCRKCGARLLGDSLFCSYCGTKVEVVEQ